MNKNIKLIAAPYTPFDDRGVLNPDAIPGYATYLKEAGIQGVFVNGTTGEGASMSPGERMKAAEAWCNEKDGSFRVLVHVGDNNINVCKQLASHAESIEADAIGLIAPNYFKPENLDALVRFNQEVASAAPALPYYYYHMPDMTGVNFPMINFLEKAGPLIPSLAGIKFTHSDLMDFCQCLDHGNGKFEIYHGRDEILLGGLALGAKGAIGSTYNYIGPLYNQLVGEFMEGDLTKAKTLQLEAIKIVKILIKYGGAVKAGKAIMRAIGFDFGQPRLPVVGYSPELEKMLVSELRKTAFFEYCGRELPASHLQ